MILVLESNQGEHDKQKCVCVCVFIYRIVPHNWAITGQPNINPSFPTIPSNQATHLFFF